MINIVVGLGGTAGRIVTHVSMIKKEDDKTLYAVLDTNLYNSSIMGEESNIPAFRLSRDMTIKSCVNMYSHLGVKEWLPICPAMLHENMANCCGQSRYMSRLCFLDFLASGDISKLENLIREAIITNSDEAFKVTVVSSLAGGAGSGIYIQIALWLRRLFAQNNCRNMINGLFILPDVFVNSFNELKDDFCEIRQLYANTYAAIKELNAITKVKVNGTALEQVNIDGLFDGVEDSGSGEPVYDYVYFIDAVNENGVSFKSIDDYKTLVVQAIEAQLFSSISERLDCAEDGLLASTMLRSNEPVYGSLGVAKAIYPTEHILQYCSLRSIQDMLSQEWISIDEEIADLILKTAKNEDNYMHIEKRKEYIRRLEERFAAIQQEDVANDFFVSIAKDTKNEEYNHRATETCVTYTDKTEDFIAMLYELIETVVVNKDTGKLSRIRLSKGWNNTARSIDDYVSIAEKNESELIRVLDFASSEASKTAQELLDWVMPVNKDDINVNNKESVLGLFTKRSEDGGDIYIHPIAIRYVLYKLILKFEEILLNRHQFEIDREKAINGNAASYFDSAKTPVVEVTPVEFLRSKKFYQPTERFIEDFKCKYEHYKASQYELCKKYVCNAVMQELAVLILQRLEAMVSVVESFFWRLPELKIGILEWLDRNQKQDADTSTVLYVYSSAAEKESAYRSLMFDSSKAVLEINKIAASTFINQFIDQNGVSQIDKNAARRMNFHLLKEFVLCRSNQIKSECDHIIDIDILTALFLSAEHKNKSTKEEAEQREEHLVELQSVIDALKHRSKPFLTHSSATACNLELLGINKGVLDSHPKTRQALDSGNLVCSGSKTPKNELLYYSSVYGIPARDINIFNENGLICRAYCEIIDEMDDSGKDTDLVMTPHLDKTWHRILPKIY